MTEDEASAVIFKRWLDAWPAASAAANGGTPVPSSFDNLVVPQQVPHALVEVVTADETEWTIGPRGKNQTEGTIAVRIVCPIGDGRKLGDKLAAAARRVFQRLRLIPDRSGAGEDGVIIRVGVKSEARRDRDGTELWVVTLAFPFEFYSRGPRPPMVP